MLTRGDVTSDTAGEATRSATLDLDPARYRTELDGFDITDAQKQELLATLWSIMRSFVELGFAGDVGAALVRGITLAADGDEAGPDVRPTIDHGDQ